MGTSQEHSVHNQAVKTLSGQGAGPVLALQAGGRGGLPAHPTPAPAQIFALTVSKLVPMEKYTTGCFREGTGSLVRAT